jgi:hypothetical protein
MHKTALAFIAALLIATAPICADTTSTYSNTTVTYTNGFGFTRETHSTTNQWRNPRISACESAILKAIGAIYAATGTMMMALAHEHYVTTNKLPSDVHTIAEQYTAKTDAVLGAALATIGAFVYTLTPNPSSN